jgi:hypothetical protein
MTVEEFVKLRIGDEVLLVLNPDEELMVRDGENIVAYSRTAAKQAAFEKYASDVFTVASITPRHHHYNVPYVSLKNVSSDDELLGYIVFRQEIKKANEANIFSECAIKFEDLL